MSEYWRTVVIDGVEHPRYKVSNLGRVKCLDWKRTGEEMLCKLTADRCGYLRVIIDGVKKSAHRLVAEAFLPSQEKKTEVEHINTIRSDNVVLLDDDGQTVLYTNLKWVNHKENCNNPLTLKHLSENAATPMLGKFGAENPTSIKIVQLTLDGKFIRRWGASREVERELGIYHSRISECCNGKRNSAGGFRWIYASDYQRKSISEIKPLF